MGDYVSFCSNAPYTFVLVKLFICMDDLHYDKLDFASPIRVMSSYSSDVDGCDEDYQIAV